MGWSRVSTGVREEEIPITARIFAIADTLDAMTTNRPYRGAMSFTRHTMRLQSCVAPSSSADRGHVFEHPEREWNETAERIRREP